MPPPPSAEHHATRRAHTTQWFGNALEYGRQGQEATAALPDSVGGLPHPRGAGVRRMGLCWAEDGTLRGELLIDEDVEGGAATPNRPQAPPAWLGPATPKRSHKRRIGTEAHRGTSASTGKHGRVKSIDLKSGAPVT